MKYTQEQTNKERYFMWQILTKHFWQDRKLILISVEQGFVELTPGKTSSPTFCKMCSISWAYQIKKGIGVFSKMFFFVRGGVVDIIFLTIVPQTSWRGIRCPISSKYFNPNFCAFVSESSFLRSSNERCPFSYNFSAVDGPMPHTSPNNDIVRTYS